MRIYPENFRILIVAEILKDRKEDATELAFVLWGINDNYAWHIFNTYYPAETRKALGLPPQLELIK